MAYNKKVWTTEKILSADLNNMEDGIDGISDLAWTFAGEKTFGDDINFLAGVTISRALANLFLDDTGGTWVELRSTGGGLALLKEGVGVVVNDLLTHDHDGSLGGTKVDYPDLTNRTHGPSDHTDRTQTVFIHGTMMNATNQFGENGNMRGPELRDGQHDKAWAGFQIKDTEIYKLSSARDVYVHLKGMLAVSGDVNLDVEIWGINNGQSSETSLCSSLDNTIPFTTSQFKRFLCNTTCDLSSPRDNYIVEITRDGDDILDTYSGDIIVCGIEIIVESDQ